MNDLGFNVNRLSTDDGPVLTSEPLLIKEVDKPPFNFPHIKDYTLAECQNMGWRLVGVWAESELTNEFIFPGLGYAIVGKEEMLADGSIVNLIGVFEKY